MSYKELKEFLKGVFPDNSEEVMDFALRAAGTSDIDGATDAKKRIFVNYILKERLDFNPQRNRQIYESLIKVVGLPPTANIAEYVLLLKSLGKKEESIITTSFEHFWAEVEKGYTKFEIIINLYWEKGIEAEKSGEDASRIREIIDQAVRGLKHDIMEAYLLLLEELYLRKYVKKKNYHFQKVFDNLEKSSFEDRPDKLSAQLLNRLMALMQSVDAAFTHLEAVLLSSIDELASGSKKMDSEYVDSLKSVIEDSWKKLKMKGEEEKIWLRKFSAEIESL